MGFSDGGSVPVPVPAVVALMLSFHRFENCDFFGFYVKAK